MKTKLFVLAIFPFLFLSCITLKTGSIESNAVITNSDFSIVGIGIGESKCVSFLGFNTKMKRNLYFQAKANLYKNYPLKAKQALTNITTDVHTQHFLLFSRTRVVMTAEIIDFNEPIDSNTYVVKERSGFRLHDSVFVKSIDGFTKGEIKYLDMQKAEIEVYFDGKTVNKSFDYKDLYRTKGTFSIDDKSYLIGDTILASPISVQGKNSHSSINIEIQGEVMGFKEDAILIKTEGNVFRVVKKEDL